MISIIDIIYIFIRYDLLLLSNHTLFLIIISSNQFYTSLQQQLSFPRDYYQYINVIFPWKNNHYSLLINQLSSVLPISSVPEKNNRYILLIFISIIYIIFPRKKLWSFSFPFFVEAGVVNLIKICRNQQKKNSSNHKI